MKLIYRGIEYKSGKQETEAKRLDSAISRSKERTSVAFAKQVLRTQPCRKAYRQDDNSDNKVILVKPIHYYTYRGVSYTKNLVFDTQTSLLLNIDRQ